MAVVAPAKNTEGGTGQTTASAAVNGGGGLVPFTQASNLHREPTGYDQTITLPGPGQMPQITLPAYGYLRSVLLKVSLTATGGTPVLAADAPWNIFTNITLTEPNGNPIFQTDGYSAYLANKYGGYRFSNDPKQWQGYSDTPGAVEFFLRIPLEIDVRDALGALPNQNSSATFRINLNINTMANVWTGAPTAATVRVIAFAEEWDQPANDSMGRPNEKQPPAMNTTQFWSKINQVNSVGYNALQFTRVGNLIRNFIVVTRNGSGARTATLPDQTQLVLDNNVLDIIQAPLWLLQMSERYGYHGALNGAGALDTGVYVYDYTHDFDGRPGFETRNLWLPTLPQSRLELQGIFAAAGSVDIITNDVVIPSAVR